MMHGQPNIKIVAVCVRCRKSSASASLFQVKTKAVQAGYVYVIYFKNSMFDYG
jgi:hypothetical protein